MLSQSYTILKTLPQSLVYALPNALLLVC
jgi:hypothetical protein